MPDDATHLFVVECKGCQRTLVTTARISDLEIAALATHLRACWLSELPRDASMLGEVMRRVRVRAAEPA